MRQSDLIARNLIDSLSFIDIFEGKFSNKITYPVKMYGQQNVGFKQEAVIIIQKCVDDILDIDHQKYGRLYNYLDDQYVFNFLIKLASEAKKENDPNKYNFISEKLKNFLDNLKIFSFSSYVRIGNLKVTKLYDFNSFQFLPNNETYLIDFVSNLNPDYQEEILKKFGINSDLYSSIIKLQINAIDDKNAKIKTLQKIADIFNVFKVLGARGLICDGEITMGSHDVYMLNQDKGSLHEIAQLDHIEKLGGTFDLDSFAQTNPHVIKKIQDCFNFEKASSLDRKILNSLIWLGESIYEPHPSHRLLKMIISIESLLLDSNDRGTKSYLLEERAAFLLANSYEGRSNIADTIKEAYTVRNSIVHSGDKQPIPHRLIKRLFLFVYDLNILFLTSDKYKTFEDIRLEVRNKKFQKKIESEGR